MVLPWFYQGYTMVLPWFTQQESLGRVPGVPGSRVDPIARGTGPAPSVWASKICPLPVREKHILYYIILSKEV